MNSVRDHESYDALAVGWALHALEPDDEQVFAGHLATCPRCQRMVRESEHALAELAQAFPPEEPPPAILARIRESIATPDTPAPGPRPAPRREPRPPATGPSRGERRPSERRPGEPRHRRSPSRRARAVRWLAAVAAVLVLVALGVWNVALRRDLRDADQVAKQRSAVISQLIRTSSKATLSDQAGQRLGYVLADGGKVSVVADGLRRNDTARTTYVLWAIEGKVPRALGTFDVLRDAIDVRAVGSIPSGLTRVDAYAVSHEPGRRAPTKPSVVVASGAVGT